MESKNEAAGERMNDGERAAPDYTRFNRIAQPAGNRAIAESNMLALA